MSVQEVIGITGMERSGTSLVARILNLLGVYLGPEEHLILETDYNPKGCWEHRELLDISQEVLIRLGGHNQKVPNYPADWQHSSLLADLRARARSIVKRDFQEIPLWGWKDTRLCLTLPFWENVIPDMKCVICIRNPLDVAASQVKWNRDLSGSYYMDLWLNYTTSALKNTAGKTRLFVFYEDIMEDWRRELQRLAAYLGNQDTVVQPGIASAVDEFISQELQHYRTSVIDVIDEARLAFPTKALYVALRMYVGGQQMSASEQTPRNDWLQRALNLFGLYALQAQAESSILHRQNSEHEQSLIFSREQIVEKDQTISELTSQLAEHIEAFAAAQQRITEQVESNAALKARVIELNEAMPTLRNEVSEREQTILTQQTKLGEYEQTISAMQSKISEHERTISAAQLKISDCEQTLSSLQTGIRERDEIIMTLQTDIVTKINEAATLNARLVEKEQYWAEITRGRGWALLQLLWRIRFRIIPRGSRRERLLGLQ